MLAKVVVLSALAEELRLSQPSSMLTIEYGTYSNNLTKKTTDLSNLQCTIQNYPNRVISALGDKLFFSAQFCKQKAIKIMQVVLVSEYCQVSRGMWSRQFFNRPNVL